MIVMRNVPENKGIQKCNLNNKEVQYGSMRSVLFGQDLDSSAVEVMEWSLLHTINARPKLTAETEMPEILLQAPNFVLEFRLHSDIFLIERPSNSSGLYVGTVASLCHMLHVSFLYIFRRYKTE